MIIFINVVSSKNTDFQFYIFFGGGGGGGGLNLIIILCFKEMRNILGYEKKDTFGYLLVRTQKKKKK